MLRIKKPHRASIAREGALGPSRTRNDAKRKPPLSRHIDGSVDPNAVLQGYRRKAASLGVEYVIAEGGRAVGRGRRHDRGRAGRRGKDRGSDGDERGRGVVCRFGRDRRRKAARPARHAVGLCGGHPDPGFPAQCFPPRRVVPDPRARGFVRRRLVASRRPGGIRLHLHRDRFDQVVWPVLAETMPAFEELRVTGCWAGLYAVNTLDSNAILGEWPEMRGAVPGQRVLRAWFPAMSRRRPLHRRVDARAHPLPRSEPVRPGTHPSGRALPGARGSKHLSDLELRLDAELPTSERRMVRAPSPSRSARSAAACEPVLGQGGRRGCCLPWDSDVTSSLGDLRTAIPDVELGEGHLTSPCPLPGAAGPMPFRFRAGRRRR